MAGRPSKLTPEAKRTMSVMYPMGATDQQVAEALGVAEQTVTNWKAADPDFFDRIKDWKSEADDRVVRSLYQKACGYERDDKYYPPDTAACIYWTKNRLPKEWRDKQEVDLNLPEVKNTKKRFDGT